MPNLTQLEPKELLAEAKRLKGENVDQAKAVKKLSGELEKANAKLEKLENAKPPAPKQVPAGMGFSMLPEVAEWAEGYQAEVAKKVHKTNVFAVQYGLLAKAANDLAKLIEERGHTGVP